MCARNESAFNVKECKLFTYKCVLISSAHLNNFEKKFKFVKVFIYCQLKENQTCFYKINVLSKYLNII
jgi:hypothetical protein